MHKIKKHIKKKPEKYKQPLLVTLRKIVRMSIKDRKVLLKTLGENANGRGCQVILVFIIRVKRQ